MSASSLTPGTDPGYRGLLDRALDELRKGRPTLVADSEDRENEVDAIMPAQLASAHWVGWMVRHTSGYLCAPMPAERADELDLPLMVARSQDSRRTAYTVSVDAAHGISTGISASERARTLRVLADPDAVASDLIRPGHVLPLRAVPGGIAERPGHTEAAVDLCRAAGLAPVGAIGELVRDDGEVMRLDEARALAAEHDLVLLTIAQLATELPTAMRPQPHAEHPSRGRSQSRVDRTATAHLPTQAGDFTMHGYRDRRTGAEHVALVAHRIAASRVSSHEASYAPSHAPSDAPTLVRVHSECLTGEAFGSLRCECGPQLDESLHLVARRGGVVVYLRGHEGRGIGLLEKVAAYALQDRGFDTLHANLERGWDGDLREYGAAAGILTDLGYHRVELLTNNPAKAKALADHGIDVVRTIRLLVGHAPQNARYLRTKAEKMGHLIALDGAGSFSGISSDGEISDRTDMADRHEMCHRDETTDDTGEYRAHP
ncbi:3,4-dihydroxy-2-butanone-4-phosphate synthase [Devriesea agamarum]|uniref:3,4-dihydroxy-2-butanone-4-phosphate synthase n=1 Tax=Devriesea agamarum TaxID=472569 RepID=UPI000AFA3709|nr:3,4-dihydroxy-2-butanone-4-phosphate synthase [Devriesea agamarum]